MKLPPPTPSRPRIIKTAYFETPKALRGIITETEIDIPTGVWNIIFHPQVRFDSQVRICEFATEILWNAHSLPHRPDSEIDEDAEERIKHFFTPEEQLRALKVREVFGLAESIPIFGFADSIDIKTTAANAILFHEIESKIQHYFVKICQKLPLNKENWSYPLCPTE